MNEFYFGHSSCITILFAGRCLKEEEKGQDSGPCWHWLWLWWEWPVYRQLGGRKSLPSRIKHSSGQVSALTWPSWGSKPQPTSVKDYNDGPHCIPVWHSVFRLGNGGLDHPMIPGCITAYWSPSGNDETNAFFSKGLKWPLKFCACILKYFSGLKTFWKEMLYFFTSFQC